MYSRRCRQRIESHCGVTRYYPARDLGVRRAFELSAYIAAFKQTFGCTPGAMSMGDQGSA